MWRRRIMLWGMNAAITFRLHFLLAAAWLALMWPTVTTWKDSILWVGLISCYANFVSHWGAGQAALAQLVAGRAEQAAKDALALVATQAKLDDAEQAEMLHRIEKAVTDDER